MKISIVIPFYNVKSYISRCLDSILAQTYKDIEIICVDDGSTDGSAELLDAYEKKDCRIVVIHKQNGGLVSARKAGKQVANGDYVVDVDGDDWIEENRVEVLVRAICKCPADLVYMSGMYRDTETNSILSEFYFKKEMFFQGEQIEKEFIPLIADPNKNFGKMLIRNAYLWAMKTDLAKCCQKEVNDNVSVGEDTTLIFYALQNSQSVHVIPNPTYHYFQRNESMSHREISREDIKSYAINMTAIETKSKLFSDLASNLIYYTIVNTMCYGKYSEFVFPYSKVHAGEKIAVYGCGGFGHRFVKKIYENKICEITCWVDKNVRQYDEIGIEVQDVKMLLKNAYDHVVIAIINEDIAREVEKDLIELGIPKEKVERIDKLYMETKEFCDYFR